MQRLGKMSVAPTLSTPALFTSDRPHLRPCLARSRRRVKADIPFSTPTPVCPSIFKFNLIAPRPALPPLASMMPRARTVATRDGRFLLCCLHPCPPIHGEIRGRTAPGRRTLFCTVQHTARKQRNERPIVPYTSISPTYGLHHHCF